MSKTLKIIILSLLLVAIATLVVGFILLLNNKNFNFGFSKNKIVYDENITDSFNEIKIESNSLDVVFLKSETEEVNVKVYDKNDDDLSVKVENETLIIKNDKKNSCWFFCGNRKAEISLPEKDYNLIVNTKSGDVTSDVDFKKATITTKSGDVEFENVEDFDVDVTSGDVKVEEVNNLQITATSGDVKVEKVNESLTIETKSGDVRINELNLIENSSIKVTSGDVTIKQASKDIYFDTKVRSGDVRINNNNRLADIELKITTTSGDITVKN